MRDFSQSTSGVAVFLDPTGRRWRRVRVLLVVGIVALAGLIVWAVPHLRASPALGPNAHPIVLTSKQTGAHPPVVGSGPLMRVLKVVPGGGSLIGQDPFTGETYPLPADQVAAAQASIAKQQPPYIIQRFGYPAGSNHIMSLTFDDGPDPIYTPKLLDVLAKYHAPATFFVTGEMASRNPQIVAREVREGHAVGNHSLTHVDVATAPAWRTQEELVITDRVLRAITGHYSSYFRLPYEGVDDETTQASINGLLRAQQWGYMVVSHDFDTEDWEYAADPQLGNIPMPDLNGDNITILMHDGGGAGRQATVDYVQKLIPAAIAAGYKFETMPQVLPALAARTGTVNPTFGDKATLLLVKATWAWPNLLLKSVFLFALISVFGIGSINVGLALIRRRRRKPRHRRPRAGPDAILPVSVLIAAYNEETVIARTIERVLASHYPFTELIVVDDGSSDDTAAVVRHAAELDSRVRLLKQPNGGKWKALNHALAEARCEVVVTLDADTVFTPRHGRKPRAPVRRGPHRAAGRGRWRDQGRQPAQEPADSLAVTGIPHSDRRRTRRAAPTGRDPRRSRGLCRVAQERDSGGRRLLAPDAGRRCGPDAGPARSWVRDRSRRLRRGVHRSPRECRRTPGATDPLDIRHSPSDLPASLDDFSVALPLARNGNPSVLRPFGTAAGRSRSLLLTMAVLTVRAQGWGVLVEYFLVFMAAHIVIAGVAVRLMGERLHHLIMVPVYRIIFEPLRAYLLFTSAYLAIRGVQMGWNKLKRTGSLDEIQGTAQVAATPPSPELVDA